jgi:HD-like signal output (HDOD) protein
MNLEDYAAVLKDLAIPPRPAVVTVLFEEMSKDEPNLGRVTKTIAADPGLSAGMLRAANSPFFGLSRKVSSVPQAIKVLGLTHVANIATGLAIRHALKGGETGQSFEKFWMKAEETGMVCHFLARSLRGFSPDEAFTYGLFHDCGIPVLSQRFPRYRDTLKGAAKATGLQDPGLEADDTRTSHSILGYFLARSWLLPGYICQAILLHHDLEAFDARSTPDVVRNFIGAGHLAEHIQRRWLGNVNDTEWAIFEAAVMRHFALTEEDVMNLVDRALVALHGED